MNARHAAARQAYDRLFSTGTPVFIGVPGRTEIGGNHTDHNQGRVLAASIHLESLACAAPSGDDRVILVSEGYPSPFEVSLDDLQPAGRFGQP